jgi:hypothetical protein
MTLIHQYYGYKYEELADCQTGKCAKHIIQEPRIRPEMEFIKKLQLKCKRNKQQRWNDKNETISMHSNT